MPMPGTFDGVWLSTGNRIDKCSSCFEACRLLSVVRGRLQPLWRNWLARSAVNRKVGGSSPLRGAKVYFTFNWLVFYYFFLNFSLDFSINIFVHFVSFDHYTWFIYFTKLTNLFSDSNWLNWMVFDISSPTYSPMFIQRQFYPICFKLGYFVSSNSR